MRRSFVQVFAGLVAAGTTLTAQGCANRPEIPQASTTPPSARADEELDRIQAAVETALVSEPPGGYSPIPKGLRLRSIGRRGDGSIVMDFNGQLLAAGTGRVLEDSLHQIFNAASNARRPVPNRADDYTVLVNGVPLETYLR
jgi:hypothetical protein